MSAHLDEVDGFSQTRTSAPNIRIGTGPLISVRLSETSSFTREGVWIEDIACLRRL